MNERLNRVLHTVGARKASASEKALVELGVYFQGSRGKLRLVGFICQVLVASTIVFALISLVDLGSFLLNAILHVADSPLAGSNDAHGFLMDLSARSFIIDASEAFVRDVPFNAIASLILTATAEIYWTKRRASRLMPPSDLIRR